MTNPSARIGIHNRATSIGFDVSSIIIKLVLVLVSFSSFLAMPYQAYAQKIIIPFKDVNIQQKIVAVTFNDENTLFVADQTGNIFRIVGSSDEIKTERIADGLGEIHSLICDSKSKRVASLSANGILSIIDEDGSKNSFSDKIDELPEYLVFNYDGEVLGVTKTGIVYHWSAGKLKTSKVPFERVLALSKWGDYLIGIEKNVENASVAKVVLFDVALKKTVSSQFENSAVTAAAISHSNDYFLWAAEPYDTIRYQDTKGMIRPVFKAFGDSKTAIMISADEDMIATVDSKGLVMLLNFKDRETRDSFTVPPNSIVSFSPDLKSCVAITPDGRLKRRTVDSAACGNPGLNSGYVEVPVHFATNRSESTPPEFTKSALTFFLQPVAWLILGLSCAVFIGFALTSYRIHIRKVFVISVLVLIAMCVVHAFGVTSTYKPDTRHKFGAELTPNLVYGTCSVSVPRSHRIGALETPTAFWLIRGEEDPESHIMLQKIDTLEKLKFLEVVKEEVAKSEKKDALIFIHGYNVTFENAARATAQLKVDLDFKGASLFFSWPSHGELALYPHDVTNADASATALKEFLETVAAESKAERLYIVAHSMGNRVLASSLRSMKDKSIFSAIGPVKEVILAAPDVDKRVFLQDIAPEIGGLATRFTLYASSHDNALKASKRFNGAVRLGDTIPNMTICKGIESVDASAVDTSMLGHSYFSDQRTVVSDLYSLLQHQKRPHQRFGMSRIEDADGVFWRLRP